MERAQQHATSRGGTGRRPFPQAFLTAALTACAYGAGSRAVAASPVPSPECRTAPSRDDILTGVSPRGELTLASGGRAVFDGLRWPEAPPHAADASAWIAAQQGRGLVLVARGEPDRWGRAHVDAITDRSLDLGGGLVEAGLATVDAGERDELCRPALLAVEAGAREARRGLWSAPRPEARDGTALRAMLGRFVVAEGRILAVGERPRRTYLDFAPKGEDGLTVTVSKRTWRHLQERGLSAAALKGRAVRVRGVMEIWRGPTLDIVSADMIEVLDGERALRR